MIKTEDRDLKKSIIKLNELEFGVVRQGLCKYVNRKNDGLSSIEEVSFSNERGSDSERYI